jgi:hypothetical protein
MSLTSYRAAPPRDQGRQRASSHSPSQAPRLFFAHARCERETCRAKLPDSRG